MIEIDWKKHFDQIFCIQFLPYRKLRGKRILDELKRVRILDSGIFQWKYCYRSPFYAVLKDHIPIRHQNVKEKQAQFDISLAHYEIYKLSYELEYQRILVLEDDIVFLKDLNEIENVLDSSPKTDVILYDKFAYNKQQFLRLLDSQKHRSQFLQLDGSCALGSAACYSLNRKAIAAFIQQEETVFYSPDELWNNWKDNVGCQQLSKSCAMTNIAIQKQYDESNSGHLIDSFYGNVSLDMSKYSI